MTFEQRIRNLSVPEGKIDVVLDTDAYNEIDDQFAISYLLRSDRKLNTVAIYAAPFSNHKSDGPKDGMIKSYDEILKILELAGNSNKENIVFKGSTKYLDSEKTPVISPAAEDLSKRAMNYTPEHPLYVAAIGAITNIASALLINPVIKNNIVVIWLGGHAYDFTDTLEFNMKQDVAAARVVMLCGVPFVQLPCEGVASNLTVSGPELDYWLVGKNVLADYLAKNTIREAAAYAAERVWTRVIWDISVIAWLLNDNNRFMRSRLVPTPIPEYDNRYGICSDGILMRYVFRLNRDEIFDDLFKKLTD